MSYYLVKLAKILFVFIVFYVIGWIINHLVCYEKDQQKKYQRYFEELVDGEEDDTYAEIAIVNNVFARRVVTATFDEKLSNVTNAFYYIDGDSKLFFAIKTKDDRTKEVPVEQVLSYKKLPSLVIERYDKRLAEISNSQKTIKKIEFWYLTLKKERKVKYIESRYFNRNMECLLKGFPLES